MNSKSFKFYLFMIFTITYLVSPNIVYAENDGAIHLTGIPAVIASIFCLSIPGMIIALPLLLCYLPGIILTKKLKDYCQKNNFKFIKESTKIPVEKKLYTSNVANTKNYYMIEMGKKQDIAYILCHYYPRNSATSAGYRTICVMIKEGVHFPHFVLGDYEAKPKDSILLDSIKMNKVSFKDDEKFSKRFFVKSKDSEISDFFNDNIRNVFKMIKSKEYYYEGNEDVFVVSYSSPSMFEKRMELLNFSLDLFNKLIENQ